MKSPIKTLCALALLTTALLPARADSPEYLNYQGLLNGADGQPLPTGSYPIEFNIYDQANLGTKQWGPFLFDDGAGNGHGPLVPVVNGRFNVIIGPRDISSVSITNAFASVNRFVEIKVNGGSPILPRQQFLSTPYAFKANRADQAASATIANSVSDANVALLNRSPQTFAGTNNFSGKVGIGTTIPAAALDVRGDIKLGPSGQYFAPAAGENLRIVRGTVTITDSTPTGSVTPTAGSGFTVDALTDSANSSRKYTRVSFPAGTFSVPPTVTMTWFAFADPSIVSGYLSGVSGYSHTTAESPNNLTPTINGFTVWSFGGGGEPVYHRWSFHFIAIGPR